MEELQFKITSNKGHELDLTCLDFKNKVAIISYDSHKFDPMKCKGLDTVIDLIQNKYNATGVFLLDKNFDLLAMDESDLGMHPDFAYKFLNNLCQKSRHKKYHQKDKTKEKIAELKKFHDHFALERIKLYPKAVRAGFVLGILTTIFIFATARYSLWNLIGVAVFFAAYCNIVHRLKRGDYEQAASEKAGNKIKGRSYDPNDYV